MSDSWADSADDDKLPDLSKALGTKPQSSEASKAPQAAKGEQDTAAKGASVKGASVKGALVKGDTVKEGDGKADAKVDKLADKVAQTSVAAPADDDDIDMDDPEVQGVLGGLHEPDDDVVVEQSDPTSPLFSIGAFEDLGLKPQLLQGIYAMKYNKPSKIQERALPIVLGTPDGKKKPENIIAQAQSGTGKTAAFTLAMLSRVDWSLQAPQALCVAPTRELAKQTSMVIRLMGRFTPVRPTLVVKDFKKTATVSTPIVVGTPGTMLSLIQKKKLDLRHIRVFVLDEADAMLEADSSMRSQTVKLKQLVSKSTKQKASLQFLLFSATYEANVEKFAVSFVPDPKSVIKLKKEELTLDKITQLYIDCGSSEGRVGILQDIFPQLTVGQTIIFCGRRDTADKLSRQLTADGHTVSVIHGGLEPAQRDNIISDFRAAKTRVLVTTSLLSRGLDILQVSLVINYDLPVDRNGKADPETYLHRIGRTGRFGRSGIAINFVYDQNSNDTMNSIRKAFTSDNKEVTIKELKAEEIDNLEDMLKEVQVKV